MGRRNAANNFNETFCTNQNMKPFWSGVFPAITTQLKKDQSLDLDATAQHVDVLIKSGVNGIVFLGSLGENQPMRPDEKRLVIEAMVKAVNGRVKVLSGVAETSTTEACRFARGVQKLGVDGIMLMPAILTKATRARRWRTSAPWRRRATCRS